MLISVVIPTYQPDDNSVVAHLGSSMQWCHPIIGSDTWICPTVLDQVLDNLQMTFLAGQVERCGTIFSLRVDKAVKKMYFIYCLGSIAIF